MSRRLIQRLQAERDQRLQAERDQHSNQQRSPRRDPPRRPRAWEMNSRRPTGSFPVLSSDSSDDDDVVIPARYEPPRQTGMTEWQRFQMQRQARREEEQQRRIENERRRREEEEYQRRVAEEERRRRIEEEERRSRSVVPFGQRGRELVVPPRQRPVPYVEEPWVFENEREMRQQEIDFILADRNAERRHEAGREMRMYQDRNDQRRYDFAMEQIRNLDRITSARAQAFQAANEARRQREADKFEREQQDDARIREMRNYRRQKVIARKDMLLDEFHVTPGIDKIHVSERHRESYMEGEPNYQWSQLFLGVSIRDTSTLGRVRIIFNNGEHYDIRTNGMYYTSEQIGDLVVVRFFRSVCGEPSRSWLSPSTWYQECIEDRNCGVA